MQRRNFIKTTSLASTAVGLVGIPAFSSKSPPIKNNLPRWKGFNVLYVLTEHEIGYALWEFDGTFGLLNSGRKDVDYEDWHGHKLDRKMLNLLMKY